MDDPIVTAYIKPGIEKEMPLSEARKLDYPEGTVKIMLSATLLMQMIQNIHHLQGEV